MIASAPRSLSWQVALEPRGRFLVACLSGVMQVDDLLRLVGHLITEARRQGLQRVLMDCRGMDPGMSRSDIYACTSLVEIRDVRRDMRTAVLVSSGTTYMEEFQFYELVAANNGWSVSLFTEFEAASAWLAGEDGSPAHGS